VVEREQARGGGSAVVDGVTATLPHSRRETWVVTSAMVLLAALAWAYLAWQPMADMTNGILTREPMPTGMPMDMEMDMPMGIDGAGPSFALFIAMWIVMMVAMMFPAASPVVLIFDRWRRSRERTAAATVAFIGGYLTVWSAAGLLAYALIVTLDTQVQPSTNAARVGGAILVAAGIYQLTPLKTACLTQCRSPLSLIMTRGQQLAQGLRGPFAVGLSHGGYCLGCCWALMVVLVAVGVMNVGWMAAVSALILAEKVLPGGRITAYAIGAGLVVTGTAFAVSGGILTG
jgi:predicted metal-binding membrane protein